LGALYRMISKRALEGIRILDFSHVYQGPVGTQILADYGADVIKVERPGSGDWSRAWGPFVKNVSLPFASLNRNKRSITVDMKQAEGKEIIHKLVTVKQGTDLCTNSYGQVVSYEFMKRGHLEPHIEKIKTIYGRKQNIMLDAIENTFDPEWVEWTRPEGGMFTWVTLPEHMDSKLILMRALKEDNVAFVIGQAFYPDGSGRNHMRLNFSHSDDERLVEGITRLGRTLKKEMED